MKNAHYSPEEVQTAVDLANTLRPIKGEDALETVEQLRDFLDDHPVAVPPGSAADQRTGPRHLTRATWRKSARCARRCVRCSNGRTRTRTKLRL